jgi:DNA-binding protein HU-beta
MTKEEFINALSEQTGFTKADCRRYLDSHLEIIKDTLSSGDNVQFIGFGGFSVSNTKAKQGINPQTGQKITIPAGKRVKFSAGKQLKDAVKSSKGSSKSTKKKK